MTPHTIEAGFTFYLNLLLRNQVGSPDRLGGKMEKPKMRKGVHPRAPKLGLPGEKGFYSIIHKGTKEWP